MTRRIRSKQLYGVARLARRSLAVAVFMWLTSWVVGVYGDDWPHWRGATRDGVVAEDSGWERSVWPPREVWRRSVGEGASSPLVLDEALIVEVGAETGTLIAFDKRTGRELWKSAANDPAGHNGGPVPMTVERVPCVVVHHFNGLLVVRTDRGKEGQSVATWPWQTDFGNNIATPAVRGHEVVLTSSYNQHKIAKLRISLAGAAKVWERALASKVCSPVHVDGDGYDGRGRGVERRTRASWESSSSSNWNCWTPW